MLKKMKLYEVYNLIGRKIDTVAVTDIQGEVIYCYSLSGYEIKYRLSDVSFKEVTK